MNPGRVLITGATRGIGLAIALELARRGGRVCITHRWGSVDDDAIHERFAAEQLQPPRIEQCDASDVAQTAELVRTLYADPAWAGLDAVVSGVAFAAPVARLEDLNRRSLDIAMGYSTWPLFELVQAGLSQANPPRRFLALSSEGVDRVLPGYEMVAVCKGALETLVRYLAVRCRPHGITVNALRLGYVDTESLRAVLPSSAAVAHAAGYAMDPAIAGRAAMAILSGLMDGMTGQVVTVDGGVSLLPPL